MYMYTQRSVGDFLGQVKAALHNPPCRTTYLKAYLFPWVDWMWLGPDSVAI